MVRLPEEDRCFWTAVKRDFKPICMAPRNVLVLLLRSRCTVAFQSTNELLRANKRPYERAVNSTTLDGIHRIRRIEQEVTAIVGHVAETHLRDSASVAPRGWPDEEILRGDEVGIDVVRIA